MVISIGSCEYMSWLQKNFELGLMKKSLCGMCKVCLKPLLRGGGDADVQILGHSVRM